MLPSKKFGGDSPILPLEEPVLEDMELSEASHEVCLQGMWETLRKTQRPSHVATG